MASRIRARCLTGLVGAAGGLYAAWVHYIDPSDVFDILYSVKPIVMALMGGLAGPITPWLAEETRRHLVRPQGDALDGALQLAAAAAKGPGGGA